MAEAAGTQILSQSLKQRNLFFIDKVKMGNLCGNTGEISMGILNPENSVIHFKPTFKS